MVFIGTLNKFDIHFILNVLYERFKENYLLECLQSIFNWSISWMKFSFQNVFKESSISNFIINITNNFSTP